MKTFATYHPSLQLNRPGALVGSIKWELGLLGCEEAVDKPSYDWEQRVPCGILSLPNQVVLQPNENVGV